MTAWTFIGYLWLAWAVGFLMGLAFRPKVRKSER